MNKILIKRSILLYVLTTIGLVWMSYGMSDGIGFEDIKMYNEEYLFHVALIGALFSFLYLLYILFINIVLNKGVLITKRGILENLSRNQLGLIKWEDIEGVVVHSHGMMGFIKISLSNEYLKKIGVHIKPPVLISTTHLDERDILVKELSISERNKSEILNFHRKSKASKDSTISDN